MNKEFKQWLSEQKYELNGFEFTWEEILRVSKISYHLSHLTWGWKIKNDG
jgi:hypothetical protein